MEPVGGNHPDLWRVDSELADAINAQDRREANLPEHAPTGLWEPGMGPLPFLSAAPEDGPMFLTDQVRMNWTTR